MVQITSEFLHTKLREVKRRVLAGEVFEITHYGEPTGVIVSKAPAEEHAASQENHAVA